MMFKDNMIRRKLYEGRLNTASRKTRKLYEQESSEFDTIRDILVGAFCFGDDGENAEVDRVWMSSGIPMIEFTQEDGRFYIEELANYLGAIDLSDRDRAYVVSYLNKLGLMESVNSRPARKKLSLNEALYNEMKLSVNVTNDDAEFIFNFIRYSRELMKEVGIPAKDPKEERIFIQGGNLYYQISYMPIKRDILRKLQTRLNKYQRNANFPTGMTVQDQPAAFIAPLEISGDIKLDPAAFERLQGIK